MKFKTPYLAVLREIYDTLKSKINPFQEVDDGVIQCAETNNFNIFVLEFCKFIIARVGHLLPIDFLSPIDKNSLIIEIPDSSLDTTLANRSLLYFFMNVKQHAFPPYINKKTIRRNLLLSNMAYGRCVFGVAKYGVHLGKSHRISRIDALQEIDMLNYIACFASDEDLKKATQALNIVLEVILKDKSVMQTVEISDD